MALALGLIPTWQFSDDPAINYNANPFVRFPPGVTQSTVQPLSGLGTPIAEYMQTPVGVPGLSGLGFFSSMWWTQRKWLALGVIGAAGVAAGVFAIKTLR